MLLININPPWQSIFTIDAIKDYIKSDDEYENDIINMHIQAAESYAERATNSIISRKNYDAIYTRDSNQSHHGIIKMKIIHDLKINSMQLGDGILSEKDYSVYHKQDGTYIYLKEIDGDKAIKFNFDGGYKKIDDLSPELRNVIMNHIAYLYENRGAQASQTLPQDVHAYYKSIKRLRF